MNDTELELLITTYFRQFRDNQPEDFWAWVEIEDLMGGDEETAFSMIITLLKEAPDKSSIAWVATGPLETLLHKRAFTVLRKIQEEVKRNRRLRYALLCIYVPQSISEEIEVIKKHYGLTSIENFNL